MPTSFNPNDPYAVGNATAAATQAPTMVFLPASLILNATILALYIVAFGWMCFGVKRNADNVATSPWWAFIVVRILQHTIGIAAIDFVGYNYMSLPGLFQTYTALYNFGLYFIIIGLIRALWIVLDISHRKKWKVARRLWGFVVFMLLTAGVIFGGMVGGIYSQYYSYYPPSDQSWTHTTSQVSQPLLCAASVITAVTLLCLAPPWLYRFIKFRNNERQFTSADLAMTYAFPVTLVLLVPRIISDQLRFWNYHQPSFVEYIGTGIIPELLITALWLFLSTIIARWDHWRLTEHRRVWKNAEAIWFSSIDDAFSASTSGTQYLYSLPPFQNSWVYFIASQHFARVLRRPDASYRSGLQRCEDKRDYLKLLASIIALSIRLDPCYQDSLFRKPDRAICQALTEITVAKSLAATFVIADVRLTLADAASLADEWTFIFLISLAKGKWDCWDELHSEVERALRSAADGELTLVAKQAIYEAVERREREVVERLRRTGEAGVGEMKAMRKMENGDGKTFLKLPAYLRPGVGK